MTREYIKIKLVNPTNSELNGIPVHNLPEIKIYEGCFQLSDSVLTPIIGKTNVRFSDVLLDCSMDEKDGFFSELKKNKNFLMYEKGTGRQLAVIMRLEEPTKVGRLDEIMATKPVIAAHALANKVGEIANYLFK
jgi:hypothetical protein